MSTFLVHHQKDSFSDVWQYLVEIQRADQRIGFKPVAVCTCPNAAYKKNGLSVGGKVSR